MPIRLMAIDATGGLAAAATLIAVAPNLPIATVGASGAVAALVAGCAVACPPARLTLFEIPLPVAALGPRYPAAPTGLTL